MCPWKWPTDRIVAELMLRNALARRPCPVAALVLARMGVSVTL